MANNAKQVVVRLDDVVISYPELFQATSMNPGDKAAFSAHFLMAPDHPSVAKIKAAMVEVATSAWGENAQTMLKTLAAQQRICLRDGNTKVTSDGKVSPEYAGKLFLAARTYTKPTVVHRNPKVSISESDGIIYGGCRVNGFVAIWAQLGVGKSATHGKRLNCQLQGVQFLADGEAFGGGRPASADVFDNLADEFGEASGEFQAEADPAADLF